MNKKAVLFAVYITFLAAAVSGYALYQFISLNGHAQKSFISQSGLDEIYAGEDGFLFYSEKAAQISIQQVFYDIINNKEFSSSNSLKFDKIISLEEFSKKIEIYFDKMIDAYPQSYFGQGGYKDYVIEVNGDSITFKKSIFLEIQIEKTTFPYRAIYGKSLVFEFTLKSLGLENFEEIHKIKEKCKADTDKKKCYEEGLPNFNYKEEGTEITLTTKKKFLLKGYSDLQEIEFKLQP